MMRRPVAPPRRARRGGFSLLEVVIALSLLGVGLLALAAMQLQAMRGGRTAAADTFATTIAQDGMERLQRLTWTDLPPTVGWAPPIDIAHPVNGQAYQVDWRIADVEPNWTRSIDVRVRWASPGRPNRSRILSSFRYNREGL